MFLYLSHCGEISRSAAAKWLAHQRAYCSPLFALIRTPSSWHPCCLSLPLYGNAVYNLAESQCWTDVRCADVVAAIIRNLSSGGGGVPAFVSLTPLPPIPRALLPCWWRDSYVCVWSQIIIPYTRKQYCFCFCQCLNLLNVPLSDSHELHNLCFCDRRSGLVRNNRWRGRRIQRYGALWMSPMNDRLRGHD